MKITGKIFRKLNKPIRLGQITPAIQKGIEQAMARGVIEIGNEAKIILTEKGHIVTGNLRREIKGKTGFASKYEIVGAIGTDVPYAPYVEALPDGGFLLEALVKRGPDVSEILIKSIERILK